MVNESKAQIRRRCLQRRLELEADEKLRADEKIRKNLISLPEFQQAHTILLYCAIKGEPDLYPLFDRILEERRRLILPKVKGKHLILLEVKDPRCLRAGVFKVPEPSDGKEIGPAQLDVAVVPGVAFDREGYRLGFGKGYYDRLLGDIKAPKVGVAYSFQVLDRVPRDPWDIPVDIVVTEKEVIRRS